MNTLSILGAGHVGQTLGTLFARADVFQIAEVRCRNAEHAASAVQRMGAGEATSMASPVQVADVYMLTVPDDQIAEVAACLRQANLLTSQSIVFHCSGALSSRDLPLQGTCSVASIHPAKSFASIDRAVETFPGCWCACEGDPSALDVLRPAFESIGARTFTIEPDQKLLYHIGCVFGCNYLTVLLDIANACLERAGVPEGSALTLLQSLVEETVRNNVELGSPAALTGPVARGDIDLLKRELEHLREQNASLAELYRRLGRHAIDIVVRKGSVSSENAQAMQSVFQQE